MSNKFETLLDYLVNEEMDKANELFHDIVVEKSREIYENLIAEEDDADEAVDEASDDEDADEAVDEASDEDKDDEAVDEGFGDDQESSFEIGGDKDSGGLGGDPSDDMVGDVGDDAAMGGLGGEEDGDAPATKDDVSDLANSIEELKAEFQALLAGEEHEEENDPDVHGGALDDLESDAGDDDMDMGGDDDEAASEAAFMREYREVVGKPYGGGKVAGKTEESSTNTLSTVSSGKGKPTTGATAGNIVQKSEGDKNETGKTGGLVGGLKSGDLTRAVEVNMDGKETGVKKLAKVAAGHGAEKKGAGPGPVGSGSGDKAGQTSVPANKTFLKKL